VISGETVLVLIRFILSEILFTTVLNLTYLCTSTTWTSNQVLTASVGTSFGEAWPTMDSIINI